MLNYVSGHQDDLKPTIVSYIQNEGDLATCNNYNPPLYEAAFHGKVDVVRLLLDHGADPRSTHYKKKSYDSFCAMIEFYNNDKGSKSAQELLGMMCKATGVFGNIVVLECIVLY